MNAGVCLSLALSALLLVTACEPAERSQPPGRLVAAMAIDSANYRAILFGGIGANTVHYDDVWSLSLDDYRWQLLNVAGTSPGGRARHAMVYDSPNRRMLVFGGNEAAPRTLTYYLNLK